MAVVVIGNVVALATYLKRSTPPPVAAPAVDAVQALAAQQRDQGLEALRQGQYELAVTKLEAAAKLDPQLPQVDSLIEVARKLREKPEPRPEPPPAPPVVPVPTPAEPIAVAPRPPPPARVSRPTPRARVEREASRPVEAATGLLIVSTTPSKLLVQIDGQPRDLTPLRLELPVGRHQVSILDGNRVVLEREATVTEQGVAVINETISTPAAVSAVIAPPPPAPSGLGADDKLNLVGLIDQPSEALAARTPPPTVAVESKAPAAPRSGPPRVVVLWSGGNASGLEQKLGAAGIEARVLTRGADFAAALKSGSADAYLAAPAQLRQYGLQAALLGQGAASTGKYLAASLRADLSKAQLASSTLGVVDELGKKEMTALVTQVVGSAQAPKLRRVTKVEDLLPLLQFKMADAIIVKSSDFPTIKARTQQTLHVVELGAAGPALALAFSEGGRRGAVEQALRGSGPRGDLGIERWVSP